MSGQPKGFDAVMVIPTEPVGEEAPALVIEMGDSITLKTYLHCDPSMGPIYLDHVTNHLVRDNPTDLEYGEVEYHLQNLETGAMVPTIHGPTPVKLPPPDVLIAFGTAHGPATTAGVVEGDLKDSGLPTNGTYFISAPTAAIATGDTASAKLVVPPLPDTSGTWRILVHAHGHAKSMVSAFNDECVILVER